MMQQRPARVRGRQWRPPPPETPPPGAVRRLASQHAQDASGTGDLALGLLGGGSDLDALESQQGDDHGGEPEEQRDDHQSAARLHVTCDERKPALTGRRHRGATESCARVLRGGGCSAVSR